MDHPLKCFIGMVIGTGVGEGNASYFLEMALKTAC